MALMPSEERLIALMSKMKPREQSKQAPRVRAAYKHALAKRDAEMTAQQDRQDQEKKLGVKRGLK